MSGIFRELDYDTRLCNNSLPNGNRKVCMNLKCKQHTTNVKRHFRKIPYSGDLKGTYCCKNAVMRWQEQQS
jgi:hypothetical protein